MSPEISEARQDGNPGEPLTTNPLKGGIVADWHYTPCSVEGCKKQTIVNKQRRLCNGHYKRFLTAGTTKLAWERSAAYAGAKCSAGGCDRVATRKGLCGAHYGRAKRRGPSSIDGAIRENYNGKRCSVDGCDRVATRRGLCGLHYGRIITTGTTDDPKKEKRLCSIDGCGAKHAGHGYCKKHLARFRSHGDPLVVLIKRHRGPARVVKQDAACLYCGCNFKRKRVRLRTGVEAKFCSNWCSRRYKQNKPLTTKCRVCEKEFVVKDNNKTCSDSCRDEARKVFQKSTHLRRRTDPAYLERRRMAQQRRRARQNSLPSEDFSFSEIYERDGGICQLCGMETDPSCGHNSDLYPTIDHIVPISMGGGHTRGNVQLAHRLCNISKGGVNRFGKGLRHGSMEGLAPPVPNRTPNMLGLR